MKVVLSIECNTEAEMQNVMAKLSSGGQPGKATEVVKAAKEKVEAKEKKETKTEDVDLGFGDEEKEEVQTKKLKLKLEDVIQGFKEYAQKNSREAAGKLLGKHGVTSVRDLKEAQFEKVMKDLSK